MHVTVDLYCMFSFCPTLKEVVWVSPVPCNSFHFSFLFLLRA